MLKSWIKSFTNKNCEKEVEILTKENEELKNKLLEKQEVINKTNAYWKKKMREKSSKDHKKS